MPPEMEFLTTPLTTQPYLLGRDAELIEKVTDVLLDLVEHSLPYEAKKLKDALRQYNRSCDKAFLASEHIRNFLLFSLLAVFITSFILLVSLPVSVVGMIFIGVTAFLIASVNMFNLCHQVGYQQEIDSELLKNRYLDSVEKLTLTKINKASEKNISAPIFDTCLFTLKKSLSEKSTDKENLINLNPFQNHSPEINEEFIGTSIESNSSQSARTL